MPEFMVILLQLLMVPGGWYAVHRFSIAREQRSEWRKLALSLIPDIEKLEKQGLVYHKAQNRDPEAEEEIIKNLERLAMKLGLISVQIKKLEINSFNNFSKAITYNNFQTASFRCQDSTSPILKGIMRCSTQLIREIYLSLQ
ncbi:MAG: hypothetical protein HDQ91_05615 [Desulfovibrio sp.]|nr:hypothetical protein [Desulfovibrio sp.]